MMNVKSTIVSLLILTFVASSIVACGVSKPRPAQKTTGTEGAPNLTNKPEADEAAEGQGADGAVTPEAGTGESVPAEGEAAPGETVSTQDGTKAGGEEPFVIIDSKDGAEAQQTNSKVVDQTVSDLPEKITVNEGQVPKEIALTADFKKYVISANKQSITLGTATPIETKFEIIGKLSDAQILNLVSTVETPVAGSTDGSVNQLPVLSQVTLSPGIDVLAHKDEAGNVLLLKFTSEEALAILEGEALFKAKTAQE